VQANSSGANDIFERALSNQLIKPFSSKLPQSPI
jgi:hypothetical protein